jgi:hypothetical protein
MKKTNEATSLNLHVNKQLNHQSGDLKKRTEWAGLFIPIFRLKKINPGGPEVARNYYDKPSSYTYHSDQLLQLKSSNPSRRRKQSEAKQGSEATVPFTKSTSTTTSCPFPVEISHRWIRLLQIGLK